MDNSTRLRDVDQIRSALDDPGLVPPHAPGSLGRGATRALRDQMARFSAEPDHAPRRHAVEGAIARLDLDLIASGARDHTVDALGSGRVDAIAVARTVPTRALATAVTASIDVDLPSPSDQVVADVKAVVRAIGLGEYATPATDAATERLMNLFATHPDGAVAAISILYQNVDATAALVTTTLLANACRSPRVAAVPRTVRAAALDTSIAGHELRPGDAVVLEIGAAGLEFGSGPHACPGRAVAEIIAELVCETIIEAGYRVDVESVEVDSDGRPTQLELIDRSGNDSAR